MPRILLSVFLLLALAACNGGEIKTPVDSAPAPKSMKTATLEELIFEFQEAIPDSINDDPAYWNEVKAKSPAEIQDSTKEGYRDAAHYFINLESFIRDGAKDTARWNEGYNSYDWEESMRTNYTNEKCARLILYWYGYFDATKMGPAWKAREAEWKSRLEAISKQ